MNKIWIPSVVLLLISYYTKAQSVAGNKQPGLKQRNTTVTEPPFKITKGYYSIYQNTEKLNYQPLNVVIKNSPANNYTKGFYATGNKYTQLHKGGKSFIVTSPRKPLARKGYYSIKTPVTNNPEENPIADGVDTTDNTLEEN